MKQPLTYEEIKQYQGNYTLVPIVKEIYADVVTPITLLRKIALLDKQYYLLESVEGGEKWGRYSFLGFQPMLQLLCKKGEVTLKSGTISTKVPATTCIRLSKKKTKPHCWLRTIYPRLYRLRTK